MASTCESRLYSSQRDVSLKHMFGLDLTKEAADLHKLMVETGKLVKETAKLNGNIERLIVIMERIAEKANIT